MGFKKSILGTFVFILSTLAHADYVATGEFTGVEDGMFGSKHYTITWLQNSKGDRWQLPKQYKDKDIFEFHELKTGGVCLVRVKSQTGGIIGLVIDTVNSLPTFYGTDKANDKPKKIDPDYYAFSCRKI
jgi:hypothetical protein